VWATEVLRAAAGATAAVSFSLALAQPAVTDDDTRRARERHGTPTNDQLRRTPAPAAPRIDKLPVPATRAPIDLEALSRGFGRQLPGSVLRPDSGPTLLVFVSFAMPEKALVRLAQQASRVQATMMLRGLVDGSLTRTAARVHGLLGARAAIQIDPQAFDRYAVAVSPSFVLVPQGVQAATCAAAACAPADGYVIVTGDVSIDYALRHIERVAPRFAKDARALLSRLER
jgi:conjugal transfer pilus assembly protein TrbC